MRWRGPAPALEVPRGLTPTLTWDSEVNPAGAFDLLTSRVPGTGAPLTEVWITPGDYVPGDMYRAGFVENPVVGTYQNPVPALAFPAIAGHVLSNPWTQLYRSLGLRMQHVCSAGSDCGAQGTATLVAFLPTAGDLNIPQSYIITPTAGACSGDCADELVIVPRTIKNGPGSFGALRPAAAAPWLTALGPRLLFRWNGCPGPVRGQYRFNL